MASIILTGLSATYPLPGVYVELDFAQGPASGSNTPRTVILLGNKTASGSATVETVIYGPDTAIPCQTEADVINLFGTGSQLHRMFLRFTAINKVTSLYFCAVAVSAGAQATATQTITNTSTSNGNCRVWCEDMFVDTPIATGQNVTTIATNIVAAVNSQTRWPVTASNIAGVITYTAVNTGPEGNWIKMQALITPGTGTITTTTSLTSNTLLSGGTTADTIANALATIQPGQYYYVAIADSDSTNAGRLSTQVNTNAAATVGIRQRGIFGSADTLSNTTTTATGINNARMELIWNGSTAVDLAPAELAATCAALYSLLEQGSPYGVNRKNFSNFPASGNDATYWPVIAGRAGIGGAPTPLNLASALNNGITPLSVNTAGAAYLVKGITTRSLNGSVSDYRVRDRHKVSVCDYWCSDVQAVLALNFGGKDLLPDPIPGQPGLAGTGNGTSPRILGNAVKDVTNNYQGAGQWTYPAGFTPSDPTQTPGDVINANTIAQAESVPPTRVSILAPLAPVNILDQVAVLALQVA